MKTFKKFILEYRANLEDGTPKPSVQVHNGKNPNRMNKKKLHTVGDYQPVNGDAHKVGKMLTGAELDNLLTDHGFDFIDGETHGINNSGNALYMYSVNGQKIGKIVDSK